MAQVMSCCCLYEKTLKNVYGNIPYMFDYWANAVVHLLILKSSTVNPAPTDQ